MRTAAAEAIARVGPLNQAATEALVGGLASPDDIVRAHTAEALGTIGASAEEAAQALVEAMADDNDRVRAKAVEALGKIGECAAAAAVPGLMRALRDRDNGVCALAAEALGQMGESADGAIPALVRSLRHISPEVRRSAAEALGKMGGAAAGARSSLEAAAATRTGGSAARPSVPWVRSAARRRPPLRCSWRGYGTPIPWCGPRPSSPWASRAQPSEATLDTLMLLLDDANDQVKVQVTRVLPSLAGPTSAVIDGLCRRLLDDDSDWVQVCAALALGRLGPAAAAAGGPLLHAARTGEVGVREQAMRAIAKIQPPEMAEAFVVGLKDACVDVRTGGVGGLDERDGHPGRGHPRPGRGLGRPGDPGPGELRARPGPARRHPRRRPSPCSSSVRPMPTMACG